MKSSKSKRKSKVRNKTTKEEVVNISKESDELCELFKLNDEHSFEDLRDKVWNFLEPIVKNRAKLYQKLQSSHSDFKLVLNIFLCSQTNIFDQEIKIICDELRALLEYTIDKIPDLASFATDFKAQISKFEDHPEQYCKKNKVSPNEFNLSKIRPFWLHLILKLNNNVKSERLVNKHFNTVLKMACVRFLGSLLGDIEKARYFMLVYDAAVTK